MSWQIYLSTATAAALIVFSVPMLSQMKNFKAHQLGTKKELPFLNTPTDQLPRHIQILNAQLPKEAVILQSDIAGFQQALNYSWAQPIRETIPSCIVRPANTAQLATTVAVLKQEHDRRGQADQVQDRGFFAVRSGGASTTLGAATLQDGVVIDLSLFCDVVLAADGLSVSIGAGARFIDVYRKLDEKGLVTIGGRVPPIGVGGLCLQGKILGFLQPLVIE
jgi:FAD/FMN-containing dehydrogenase